VHKLKVSLALTVISPYFPLED